jgi:hypothetical protein
MANRYPLDGRGTTYAMAFFCPKHSGLGSYYLMATKDNQGRTFGSGSTYRLRVPPNVPVRPGLQANSDGSVDIYFGAAATATQQSNFVPTSPNGEFEVLFRFYGPDKSLFEKKTCRLPDIEKV